MTEYEMMKAKNSKREIKTPSIPLFLFENYTVRIIITTGSPHLVRKIVQKNFRTK